MKQEAGKGVAVVSVKSKRTVKMSKLKPEITAVQRRKKETLEEPGNIAQVMLRKNSTKSDCELMVRSLLPCTRGSGAKKTKS